AGRPIRSVAVWGWAPGVHVLSEIPSPTRDSNPFFLLQKGSLQVYYRNRYLDDLRANPPDVFIDALTPATFMWEDWTEKDGYESIPKLRSFVDQSYVLARELVLQNGTKPVRFYVRQNLYSGS